MDRSSQWLLVRVRPRALCSIVISALSLTVTFVGEMAGQDSSSGSRVFEDRAEKLREAVTRKPEPRVIAGDQNTAPRSGQIYPWKTYIVSTVYAIGDKGGEKKGTVWDPEWQKHYGGFDDPNPSARSDFHPMAFHPGLNPFYVALPYNDVEDGKTKPEAREVIPWFRSAFQQEGVSICKDRWVAIQKGDRTCYAQWSDCGPHRSDHWQYVFGNERPTPNRSKGAGISVSPAVRDYLGLHSEDLINWKFVEFRNVPQGPWARFGENNPFVRNASGQQETRSER